MSRARTAHDELPRWCRGIETASGPIYAAIADALDRAISSGLLGEGDRIPTHRQLARLLGVDLTTVTRAYAVAARRSLIEAQVGRGTFVRYGAAAGKGERAVIDMTMNLPPTPNDPALADALRTALGRLVLRADLPALMSYRWGAGTEDDRAAGAAWLLPCLGRVEPARLLVCPGAQAAMFALATTYLQRGDTMLAESTTYPGIRAVAAQLGLNLVGVEIDGEGFVPEALDRALRLHRPRLVYCNPTIQNPTAYTMGERRRRDVARVLGGHDALLLEDDAYGLFPSVPMPALATLLPERTFYVATTAKSLSPGLRVAYVVAPNEHHAERLGSALRAAVLMQTGLLTTLVTGWIRSGEAAAMLSAIRREAAARQRLARTILGGPAASHPDGLHVWLHLPPRWSSARFTEYVRDHGLAVVGASAFAIDERPQNAVRVALGAAQTRDELGRALQRIASAMITTPPPIYDGVI